MSGRYEYFYYDGKREAGTDDFEHDIWRHEEESPFGRIPGWFVKESQLGKALLWIGALFFGLGFLIILFPMLLVFAIAGIFFTIGVVCLSMWWRLREQSQRLRIGPSWRERAERWLRARFQ